MHTHAVHTNIDINSKMQNSDMLGQKCQSASCGNNCKVMTGQDWQNFHAIQCVAVKHASAALGVRKPSMHVMTYRIRTSRLTFKLPSIKT